MTWVLVIAVTWLVLAALLALFLGKAVHLADLKARRTAGNAPAGASPDAADPPPKSAPPVSPARSPAPDPTQVEGASTIPGIPAARPRLGPPKVPHTRPPIRRSGTG
jgi:hypothetical protein